MRRQLAATRRDPETASSGHHQGPIIDPSPGAQAAGTAAVVVVAASLVDDIKQRRRSGAAKHQPSPKKTYPSSQSPAAGAAAPILGSRAKVQNRNTHMGKGVLHTVYSLQKKKKGSVDRVCCCCESGSVGMAGRFRRTNERTNAVVLWCLVVGGRSLRDPRLGLAWAPK